MTLEVHTTVSTEPRSPPGALTLVMSTVFAKVDALFPSRKQTLKKKKKSYTVWGWGSYTVD